MKIVVTGGHHTPAVAVIDEIKRRNPNTRFYWFGHKHTLLGNKNSSFEYVDITSKKIPFFELKAGKLYKTYNLKRLFKIPVGFVHAFILLRKINPDVVLSFGGYLGVPVVFFAKLLKIPSLTHEQTVVVGYANKFISKFADKVLVSYKESLKHFPKSKTVVVGLPLREGVFSKNMVKFKSENDLPTIFITAGKTGSHLINRGVEKILFDLLKVSNVIHQCGDNSITNDYKYLSKTYSDFKNKPKGNYFLNKFLNENEIGAAYNKANLVICRSGANTVSELLALKKFALLIPIPWVSHDEQNKNAQLLVTKNLGIIFEENNLINKDKFLCEIKKALASSLKQDKDQTFEFSNEPARKIVDEIEKLTKKI